MPVRFPGRDADRHPQQDGAAAGALPAFFSVRGRGRTGWIVALGLVIFALGFGSAFLEFGPEPAPEAPERVRHSLDTPALLLSTVGTVGLQRGTDLALPAVAGQALEPGDLVTAHGRGAAARLLTPEGVLTVATRGTFPSSVEGLGADEAAAMMAAADDLRRRFHELRAAGVPPVPEGMILERPIAGTCYGTRPSLRWRDSDDRFPYRIEVVSGDRIVLERTVRHPDPAGGKAVLWPAEQPDLDPGRAIVRIRSADGDEVSGTFEFRPFEELGPLLNPIERLAGRLEDFGAVHSLCALRFAARGDVGRAVRGFRQASSALPEERFPLEALVVLLVDSGSLAEVRPPLRRLEAIPEVGPLRITPASTTEASTGSGSGSGSDS